MAAMSINFVANNETCPDVAIWIQLGVIIVRKKLRGFPINFAFDRRKFVDRFISITGKFSNPK